MFKAGKRLTAVCIILVCTVFVLLVGFHFSDLLRVREDIEYRRTAEAVFSDVWREMGKVRGLPLPDRVELEIVAVSWARENWGWKQVEAASREIEIEERIYKALFLIPENVSLREVKVQQAGAILAASWENKVYIVKERFNPYDKPRAKEILAHELTHILQGRYFKTPERGSHDGKQAWSALIEGDAGLTTKKYLETEADPKNPSALTPAQEASFSYIYALKIPDSLMRIWLFPYQYGENFVRALYADGGWTGVNQAYKDPPQSTEQIMHPEKYLEGEWHAEVEAAPLNASGWISAKTDRLGEHFILVMLETHLPTGESAEAAEGWNGDNFTYYERGDDYMFTWRILWDTEEDAVQFSGTFADMMRAVGAERLAMGLWKVRGKYISFRRDGLSTLIVGSTTMSHQVSMVASAGDNPD
jgi:hypothetical protein